MLKQCPKTFPNSPSMGGINYQTWDGLLLFCPHSWEYTWDIIGISQGYDGNIMDMS